MVTLLEIVYRVLNPTHYRINKDQLPREDETINAIITARARIIGEGFLKTEAIHLAQNIPIDKIEPLKDLSIGGFTVKSPINLFEAKIPRLIDNISWENIIYVGSSSFGPKAFLRRVNLPGFVSQSYNGWTGHMPSYCYVPAKLLFKNLAGVNGIFALAIVSDPREVEGFDENGPFPLPESMLDRLIISVQRELFGNMIPNSDQSQNQIDETSSTTQQPNGE